MTVVAEQTFAPPGPGSWFLDPTHFTRPVTRFHAELFPREFIRGFGEGFLRYGCLLEYLDGLRQRLPLLLPPSGWRAAGSGRSPAEGDLGRARASHPEIRRRLETSATVFERKLWREDLERWDRETKPAAIRDHLALLAIEPRALDTTSCSRTSTGAARTR